MPLLLLRCVLSLCADMQRGGTAVAPIGYLYCSEGERWHLSAKSCLSLLGWVTQAFLLVHGRRGFLQDYLCGACDSSGWKCRSWPQCRFGYFCVFLPPGGVLGLRGPREGLNFLCLEEPCSAVLIMLGVINAGKAN